MPSEGGALPASDAAQGFEVVVRDRVGSTSDELREMARDGAPHGTVLRAVEQVAGRGRNGRRWASPPGNLYMSVLMRCALPVRRAAEAGFVVALAAADAVDGALPHGTEGVRLKWPNDVQVRGAKIAGVLTELLDEGAGVAVIAGVGLNVAHAPEGLPYPATCLRAEGAEVGVEAVAAAVLASLGRRWAGWVRDGFGPVREDWLLRGPAPGARLSVSLPGGGVDGSFAGLGEDGALLLRTGVGVRRIVAGEVTGGL